MNSSWWDRWEDQMNFVPRSAEPRSVSIVAGTLATLAVVLLFTALVYASQLNVGHFVDGHCRTIAAVIMVALISLAALASRDGTAAAP